MSNSHSCSSPDTTQPEPGLPVGAGDKDGFSIAVVVSTAVGCGDHASEFGNAESTNQPLLQGAVSYTHLTLPTILLV